MLDTYALIDDSILKDIADAIRERSGQNEDVVYKPSEMAEAISQISYEEAES